MSKRLCRVLPCSALVLLLLAECLFAQSATKSGDDLLGTWTNKSIVPGKMICVAGAFQDFYFPESKRPLREGTFQIVKRWEDEEGSVYYESNDEVTAGANLGLKVQTLWKLSKGGTVLESLHREVSTYDPANFPPKMDPTAPYYTIYNREMK